MNQLTLDGNEIEPVSAVLDREFEQLWALFKNAEKYKLCTVGSKAKAKDQFRLFKQQNPTQQEFEMLLEVVRQQARYKYQVRRLNKRNDFVPNFPQVFRYLRDGRFNDEIVEPVKGEEREIQQREDKQIVDESVRQRIAEITDRSWAE